MFQIKWGVGEQGMGGWSRAVKYRITKLNTGFIYIPLYKKLDQQDKETSSC